MTPSDLDALLAGLARQPVPELPGGFRSAVWDGIDRRAAAPASRWETALAALLRPRPVAAVLGLALCGGLLSGWVRPEPPGPLSVFSAEAPGLPATLIGR